MDAATLALVTCFGLALTAAGAGITAQAVFTAPEGPPAAGYSGVNRALRISAENQAAAAKLGLRLITGGTIIQIITTALPFFI